MPKEKDKERKGGKDGREAVPVRDSRSCVDSADQICRLEQEHL